MAALCHVLLDFFAKQDLLVLLPVLQVSFKIWLHKLFVSLVQLVLFVCSTTLLLGMYHGLSALVVTCVAQLRMFRPRARHGPLLTLHNLPCAAHVRPERFVHFQEAHNRLYAQLAFSVLKTPPAPHLVQ